MASDKEPASLRIYRLFNSILTRSGPMQTSAKMKISHDALLDAFIFLYEECTKESLNVDPRVQRFLQKYRTLVNEIKSLRVNLDDFEIQHVIGSGYFGEIKVVKEKLTNDLYAMKTIKKCDTAYIECTVMLEEEHDIMCTAASHWITKLQYSFQDKNNLYFIMEYNAGGDLLSLIYSHSGRLSPGLVRFYLAEIALAIRALHQMGYVHRDIKAENIFLDRCGHVKLGDFGCASKLTSLGTVCHPMPLVTARYPAPELVCTLESRSAEQKLCYGIECDYWSLGILAYELVVGRTTFFENQIKLAYVNIKKPRKKLRYPEAIIVPESLNDLTSKLLQDRETRLKHDGIIKHNFFTGVNWTNIRNEAPPIVPTPKLPDQVPKFSEQYSRKLILPDAMKDSRKEFSGKNLPFIGFSYSGSTDCEKDFNNGCNDISFEKKNPTLETLLEVARRENKNLVSKLFEAKFGKSGEIVNLEKRLDEKNQILELCELEKSGLQKELSKSHTEYSILYKILESERQNRRGVEANALRLTAETKMRVQRDITNQIQDLQSKIEELNDRLTDAHTTNNELVSRNDRIKAELLAANNEIEILKKLESDFKSKLSEAREFKRKSAVGLESRLEKMVTENQTQTNILQQKLKEEAVAKTELEEKLKQMETTWLAQESQYKQNIKDHEDQITKLEMKINTQNKEITSLHLSLSERPSVTLLREQLELEKNECSELRAKLSNIEQELTNTTHSFMDHESVVAAQEETVQVLEKELREASKEKARLQKQLQKTKEADEENRQKLSSLEVVVDRLEQGVLKLEAENAKLKQRVAKHGQPVLTSEAETRYQEKIALLEDQVTKLELQLQKLRETVVLDKESLKSTQTVLWKTEKELSDAKIDLRIAKREAKTSEELINRLRNDIKTLKERLEGTDQENQEKLEKLMIEKADLKSEISKKETEIKMMKNRQEEFEKLKELEKELKKEYNELSQKHEILEKQADDLREEKEKAKEQYQTLVMEKLKIETAAEELRHKICSLELNNQVLKETGTMLDEQLEDYDKFMTTQTQKIEGLVKEKTQLEKQVENIQMELRTCRQNLNEEKSLKIRAEQRAQFLQAEISSKDESLTKLLNDLSNNNALLENTKMELAKSEETIGLLEVDIDFNKKKYDSLKDEFAWLKKETTSYLTSLYSLRESNYKLTQDLEEAHHLIEALRERVEELQNVITDLEAFHKQREIKDEATKHQQSKLISFLQEKLEDTRKKKTIADVLFGGRSKEHITAMSPVFKSDTIKRSKDSSKDLLDSPATKEALTELVKSPSSQSYFQRQSSVQRMHHSIPHRFISQQMQRSTLCASCSFPINRGTRGSSCTHCGIHAHSQCASIIPKTCGLPEGLMKHYAQSVVKTNTDEKKIENFNNDCPFSTEGWINMLNSSKTAWEKKYARFEGNKISIFENPPTDDQLLPILILNLCQNETHVQIGDNIDPDEIPHQVRSTSPYIIKIVKISSSECYPQETYYLMMPTSDKSKWMSILSCITLNSNATENYSKMSATQKYQGTLVHTFPKENPLDLNCVVSINDKIILLGTEEGLFSLKQNTPNAEPVRILGPTKIQQLTLVPQIGVALMIASHSKRLLICDYRALVSNAEAASCTNPEIAVKDVNPKVVSECCLMFSVSPIIEDCVYLTVATISKVGLLTWCMKTSQFVEKRVMETFHPCNCVIYTKNSVILGCDRFFEIELKNLFVKEFLHSSVKSLAFWRVGSFPMEIFEVNKNEYLLCFNEFGVFVNGKGKRTQCDLKWSKVPYSFAYSKPYLYVVHISSVEVIRVPFLDSRSTEDSICTSSTSTVSDSVYISLNNPRYLGYAKAPGAIYLRVNTASGIDIVILEGSKLYKEELGSCASLNIGSDETRVKAESDEFSFTSSLVHSLEEIECSTPRHSDGESGSTYTVSDTGSNAKKVTFMQKEEEVL